MDNENKKVNNAEESVRKPASSREEELRKRDEKRRALEMQAIREDIERRYSLQLETAKSNTSPSGEKKSPSSASKILPEIDERETVREELERIDEIISNEKIVEVDKCNLPEKPSKPAETEPDFDIDETNPLYAAFYTFGDTICRILSRIFLFIRKLLGIPVTFIIRAITQATESTKNKSVNAFRATVKEAVNFRREIRRASKKLRNALRHPSTLPSALYHYIKQAVTRHTDLLKTTANILLPVCSLCVLLLTLNYWNNATFALEVIYNNQSIGYISDESVYIEAKGLVKDRLSGSEYASQESTVELTVAQSPNLNAQYNLSLVSVDSLNDAQAISDKMIENSVDNLTHACGIYIDGEFICAVKNEADAKTVFYDILEPYEAQADANGYVVGFAETIDYVQGLYRDDKDVMWDATQLSGVLTGRETPVATYTVSEGDTLLTIIENTAISEQELRRLNPSVDFDNLEPGTKIVTKGGESLVSIRKIVTTTSIRDVDFSVVKKSDSTKYSGYRKVLQKGINGSERVTKTQIYINGELQDTEYYYETITEPVDEIVTVGTKTTYGGVYIGEASDSGFLWPAPSCHRVSSPYGWRSSGWHNGIDLVRSGGGAYGTPVIASQSGRVEVVQRSNSGYGNMVLINHGNGYKTRYAHMVSGSITVSVGDYVEAGRTIGKVGSTGNSTGPHLHFEVIYQGETQNPKNYIY